MRVDRIHLYPVDHHGRTTHTTDHTEVCACCPMTQQVCPESQENPQGDPWCPPTCYRCGGAGLVDPYTDERVILIIHRLMEALVPHGQPLCYPRLPSSELGAH